MSVLIIETRLVGLRSLASSVRFRNNTDILLIASSIPTITDGNFNNPSNEVESDNINAIARSDDEDITCNKA